MEVMNRIKMWERRKRQREIGRKGINIARYSTRRKIMWRENRHWKRPKKGEEKEVRTWEGR